jgi:glycosyltransferase involved in cell wall biosynthesis
VKEFFNLERKVFLKGHSNDIRAIWEEHHIYLLPSTTESAPISLVEAMICGRPSVVTNVGGVTEWVEEGKEGFVSETANPWLLSEAILRAFKTKEEWEVMGINAHEKAVNIMGCPTKDLLQLIESVVD